MPRGIVKWFSAEKGYGFIQQENGGEDVFVHRSAVVGLGYGEELRKGERLSFEIRRTPKGLQAVDVKRLDV
ncbi:cold-shock protein [Rhodothermus bifroesti]|uniref:Cold-shock protein n=1 Tax=Rhodothermus marinus TaxID=29549 RepID=A0A7V2B0J0_RHOMR|nr:cold-shock protein [Rhodothermus bifroesti]GBD00672.1 putative cold shock protein A [bacterium HR18]